ncbi:MAG: hypothetical protein U0836_04125 [Pirellulales bacterium]
MKSLSQLGALVAVYAVVLAGLAWAAIGSDSHRPESEGFIVGAALLTAVALVLGDLSCRARAWATIAAAAYFLGLLWPAVAAASSDEFQGIGGSRDAALALLTWLSFVVGTLFLVRAFLGSIGPPRAVQSLPRTSLRTMLGVTAYFALVTLAFVSNVPRESEQRDDLLMSNAITALILSAACIGPVLAVLGTSLKVRATGAAMLLGTFALLAWALSETWPDPSFWRLALALGGALLTPFVGAVILRCCGYRLHSGRAVQTQACCGTESR